MHGAHPQQDWPLPPPPPPPPPCCIAPPPPYYPTPRSRSRTQKWFEYCVREGNRKRLFPTGSTFEPIRSTIRYGCAPLPSRALQPPPAVAAAPLSSARSQQLQQKSRATIPSPHSIPSYIVRYVRQQTSWPSSSFAPQAEIASHLRGGPSGGTPCCARRRRDERSSAAALCATRSRCCIITNVIANFAAALASRRAARAGQVQLVRLFFEVRHLHALALLLL